MIPCTETPKPWYRPGSPSVFAILTIQSPSPWNCRSAAPNIKEIYARCYALHKSFSLAQSTRHVKHLTIKMI